MKSDDDDRTYDYGANRGRGMKPDDDDRTFDYGDRDDNLEGGFDGDDDWTNVSEPFVSRQQHDTDRTLPSLSQLDEEDEGTSSGNNVSPASITPTSLSQSPLVDDDDVSFFSKSMDAPMNRVGAGVAGVAALGCVIFAPVGLMVGAAVAGAGVVVMQMPEEDRKKLHDKAKKKFDQIHEQAVDASERLGTSCASRYRESGVAEHLEPCFPIPVTRSQSDLESTRSDRPRNSNSNSNNSISNNNGNNNNNNNSNNNRRKKLNGSTPDPDYSGPSHPSTTNDVGGGQTTTGSSPVSQFNLRFRTRKVACLRNVRIVPISQIHGLDPQSQPKAWLEVLASSNTSMDEKIEAMEEISILAKDKRLARVFLDEGILDFFLFNIRLHEEKIRGKENGESVNWANGNISAKEYQATKLAAQCCMALGKAHCAAFHTEGDLFLMSMYERGTVPEERRVAQMLVEVPHHMRVTRTDDPTVVEPSKEVFSLKQLALPQAEELAHTIQNLALGRR